MPLSETEAKQLAEMRAHLGKLHDERWNSPDFDRHYKSSEGYVSVLYSFKNWHERTSTEDYINAKPAISMVEVYSYLFGPSRMHSFNTIEEAYQEVMCW